MILLDDLDNFMSVPEIVMTLKQTLSMDSLRNTRILLGIASTPISWQELTSIKKHHPLSRYFLSRVELTLLSEGDLRETIFKSLAGTGVSFNTEVIGQIYEYTKGHPFEMQVLCNHLFNAALSGVPKGIRLLCLVLPAAERREEPGTHRSAPHSPRSEAEGGIISYPDE